MLEKLAVDLDGAVDPGIIVFTQEAIAAVEEAFEEAMLVHREEHVLRGGGAEVAARTVDFGEHLLVEEDGLACEPDHHGRVAI